MSALRVASVDNRHGPSTAAPCDRELRLLMLGAFRLLDGDEARVLPAGSQRLLAFLAFQNRTVTRTAAAGALWPEASEPHAHAALRSALSRLDAVSRRAVRVDAVDLALDASVRVDLREARALANRLLVAGDAPDAVDTVRTAVAMLSQELLPGWYEDWSIVEAEDWRQLRLHALEALAHHLARVGRFADATSAALAAVRADPLRETASATLIHVHLAEGNRSEAIAAFERYRASLRRELGLAPSPELRQLMCDIQRPRPDNPAGSFVRESPDQRATAPSPRVDSRVVGARMPGRFASA